MATKKGKKSVGGQLATELATESQLPAPAPAPATTVPNSLAVPSAKLDRIAELRRIGVRKIADSVELDHRARETRAAGHAVLALSDQIEMGIHAEAYKNEKKKKDLKAVMVLRDRARRHEKAVARLRKSNPVPRPVVDWLLSIGGQWFIDQSGERKQFPAFEGKKSRIELIAFLHGAGICDSDGTNWESSFEYLKSSIVPPELKPSEYDLIDGVALQAIGEAEQELNAIEYSSRLNALMGGEAIRPKLAGIPLRDVSEIESAE